MNEDRTPPNDIAAELSVIGAALVASDKVLANVSDLRADDFFQPENREAWAAVLAVAERRMPVDVLSVGDELKARGMVGRFPGGWHEWASKAASAIPTVENVSHYAEIVRDKATLRRMIELCASVASRCYSCQPVDDVLAEAREGVATLEVQGKSGGPVKIGTALQDAVATIESRALATKPHFVKTGISTVDNYIGGLAPGDMVVVAGRPGHGKTAFADGVALWNACAGVPSLFFSLEMSLQQLIERVLSIKSRTPAASLRTGKGADGKPLTKEDYDVIGMAANRLLDVPLWVDERPLTLGRIVGEARRWHAREVRGKGHAFGLVAVDYLQLVGLETEKRDQSREQQVARISKTMKWLAKSIACPVMVLAQLNREVEKRGGKPVQADLRESGSLEQDADMIFFPWRDIPADNQDARNQDGPAEIIVAKNRSGKIGSLSAWWKAEVMEFVGAERNDEPPPHWQSRGDE